MEFLKLPLILAGGPRRMPPGLASHVSEKVGESRTGKEGGPFPDCLLEVGPPWPVAVGLPGVARGLFLSLGTE